MKDEELVGKYVGITGYSGIFQEGEALSKELEEKYPQKKINLKKIPPMLTMHERIVDCNEHEIIQNVHTAKGQSGSSLVYFDRNEHIILGVHYSAAREDFNTGKLATRLTAEYLEWIGSIIENDRNDPGKYSFIINEEIAKLDERRAEIIDKLKYIINPILLLRYPDLS